MTPQPALFIAKAILFALAAYSYALLWSVTP